MTSIAGCSNLDNQRKIWRGLWQLQVPNKIKLIVWRACNDALPTNDNLYRRHILPSNQCNIYQEHSEDVVHTFWLCKDTSSVWLSLEWFHQAVTIYPVCFRELLTRFMHCQEEYRAKIFVIAAWSTQNRQNVLHFGSSALLVDRIYSSAGNLLQEFLASQEEELVLPSPPSIQHWCPPVSDMCKVMLGTYFYVISISFDKRHFTCILVDLGYVQYFKEQEFKSSIEAMKVYPRNK